MICRPFPLHFHPSLTTLTVLLSFTEVPCCIIFSSLSRFPSVCTFCAQVFKTWQSKFFTSISITWWGPHEMASWYRTSFKKLVVLCSPKPFTALFECWLHLMDVRSLKTMYNWDKHRHYTALSINVWQNCFESCFHNYTPEVTSWTSWCLAAAHKRETVGSST